jgi:hypothetical protein
MELDLEIGDVILAGKFKNKRKIVKTIGKDDLGQPTINGMKALNFRIEKTMPKDKWSKKSKEALEFAEKVDEAKIDITEKQSRIFGNSKMKISKRQLRRIIKEEILREQGEMLKIISNSHSPETEIFNKIANYALNNDIQGALADSDVNTDDLYYDLDDMRPWVKRVGGEENWMGDDAVVPENWDAKAVYNFMDELENTWYDARMKKDKQELQSSPNRAELEAIGGNQHMILDKDLEHLTYQPRKKGGKIVAIMIEDNEGPDGFPMGNATFTMDEDWAKQYGTTLDKVINVLDQAGSTHRKKQKSVKHTPPMYD